MCLILLANDVHQRYQLIIAGNRDEYYERPTSPAKVWSDHPEILAGRDDRAGGTWLGLTSCGRFAALTNYRDLSLIVSDAPSRGALVSGYLLSSQTPRDYFEKISKGPQLYSGFSMLAREASALYYYTNVSNNVQLVGQGVFGLSNSLFDAGWPKVTEGKRRLSALLKTEGDELVHGLLEMLEVNTRPMDKDLPDTGVGLEWERTLSPIFIQSPDYGTLSSSVVLFDRSGEITFVEQTFDRGKKITPAIWFRFLHQ